MYCVFKNFFSVLRKGTLIQAHVLTNRELWKE